MNSAYILTTYLFKINSTFITIYVIIMYIRDSIETSPREALPENKIQLKPTRAVPFIYTVCLISPRPQENSVIWQNSEKYEERKVVANLAFPISSVRIFA
jgi:hypothetical protein